MRKPSPDQGAATGPGSGERVSPACPAHWRYSSSSTLMTLVGMEGRGCCSTSEPNHLARPTGELLLWLGRCSSWECTCGRPDRLGTFWGVVWTLTAAAWEPEPGGWRTVEIRRKVLIQSTRRGSSSPLGRASLCTKLRIVLNKVINSRLLLETPFQNARTVPWKAELFRSHLYWQSILGDTPPTPHDKQKQRPKPGRVSTLGTPYAESVRRILSLFSKEANIPPPPQKKPGYTWLSNCLHTNSQSNLARMY